MVNFQQPLSTYTKSHEIRLYQHICPHFINQTIDVWINVEPNLSSVPDEWFNFLLGFIRCVVLQLIRTMTNRWWRYPSGIAVHHANKPSLFNIKFVHLSNSQVHVHAIPKSPASYAVYWVSNVDTIIIRTNTYHILSTTKIRQSHQNTFHFSRCF